MAHAIVNRAKAAFERLPPKQRQYATLGAIGFAGFGVLWLVLSLSSSDPAKKPAVPGGPSDAKVTNLIMAPGQQVDPVDRWIGTAGKKLAQYESERSEQTRLNHERQAFEQKTFARFAEMEQKLLAAQAAASSPQSSAALAMPPALPPQPAPVPQPVATTSTAVPRGLPPPPPAPLNSSGALPTGAPNFEVAAQPSLMRVTLGDPGKPPTDKPAEATKADKPQTVDTYLPVSFTRGILLGGLDAPTGGQAQSNPQPILIRLSDNSVLPNRFRAEYRECFVIAAGYGDISSERAYLRTESLSCVRRDGTAMEVKIQGSVYGEDGKVGMRGRLVTKQGQMLANSLVAGVVGGIGQGFSQANSTTSTTALGSVTTTSGADAYKAGVGSGVGKALDRLAQYYIKLAEQTFPVIEIDAGREIDVVITKGVRIDSPDSSRNSATSLRKPDISERYMKTSEDDEY